jgi:arylsulfatase A-like enzyme
MQRSRLSNNIFFMTTIIILIVVISVVLLKEENSESASKDKPNIVIISVDALAANHLGVYGGDTSISPNIDKLAKSSVVFEKAYTTVPWTNGSYASLFTGNYFNKFFTGEKIDKDITTLAEVMKDSGYKTGGFYSTPNLRDSMNGLGKGFETYIEGEDKKIIDANLDTESLTSKNMRDLNTKNNSIQWIKENKNNRFFMFTHLFAPHMPYNAPKEFANNNTPNSEIDLSRIDKLLKDNNTPDLNSLNLNPDEINYLKAKYDEEIRFADYCIGQIISEIKNQKIDDHTIIIITADHGESFDHNYLHHTQRLYESSIKVPLIYFDPRYSNKPKIQTPVSLIDIFPTLTNRVGINNSFQVDGQSILSELDGNPIKRQAIFSMSMPPYLFEGKEKNIDYMKKSKYIGQQFAAMNKNYKYILNTNNGSKEIYQTTEDPLELNNLFLDPNYKDELDNNDLQTRLILWIEKNTTNANNNVKLKNEELYNTMKSLGYL